MPGTNYIRGSKGRRENNGSEVFNNPLEDAKSISRLGPEVQITQIPPMTKRRHDIETAVLNTRLEAATPEDLTTIKTNDLRRNHWSQTVNKATKALKIHENPHPIDQGSNKNRNRNQIAWPLGYSEQPCKIQQKQPNSILKTINTTWTPNHLRKISKRVQLKNVNKRLTTRTKGKETTLLLISCAPTSTEPQEKSNPLSLLPKSVTDIFSP